MPVTAADYGEALYQLLLAVIELMGGSFYLLTNNSVSADDIWNVSYHAASFGYWVAKSFVGEGGALNVMKENVSAMKNFTNLVRYIGGNAEVIFGNASGEKGVSAAIRNLAVMVDEDFALKFWNTAQHGIKLVYKLMENVSDTLR